MSSVFSRGHRIGRAALAAAALWLLPVPRGASEENAAPARGARRTMPIVPPGRARAIPERAKLEYFGGRVVSNAQIVMVLWGEGRYEPFVTADGVPSMASFFGGVAAGAYLEGLSQYDTNRPSLDGRPGTNQHIGRGTFAARVRIAPSGSDAPAVDDADVSAEIVRQLAAGGLPVPTSDAAGNVNTVYFVHLPAGKAVTLGAERSCVTFCAYHGTFDWKGVTVRYAVMPDMSPGSGCDLGCGAGSSFDRATAVASHELAEAVTDPDVGLSTGLGPPLGWYDPVNGEIADICVGQDGTTAAGDGTRYAVQKVWSNADAACVVPGTPAAAIALAADGGVAARLASDVTPAPAAAADQAPARARPVEPPAPR